MTGHADKLVIKNWYASSTNQIEEFRLSDGSKVLASQVQSLLSAMATFSVPDGMMTTGNLAHGMHSLQASRHSELAASIF